jgi:hypothetical protein
VGLSLWQSDDCEKTDAAFIPHTVASDANEGRLVVSEISNSAPVPGGSACAEMDHAVDTADTCQLHYGSSSSSDPMLEVCRPEGCRKPGTAHLNDASQNCRVLCADWVKNPPVSALCVTFTPRAEEQLKRFSAAAEGDAFRLRHLADAQQLRSAIVNILSADPRSVYRRKHCTDRLYYVTVDAAHVTCWFDTDKSVEVVRVQSMSDVGSQE